MATINLEPGDVQKIISQPSDGDAFNINVTGETVFMSHRANGVVREGKKLIPGDRTVASNLRGKPVFAKNPAANTGEATIQIDRAGFALSFQTRSFAPDVQTVTGTDAPAATDGYDNATASAVAIGNGGSTSATLSPPGRSEKVMLRVEGTAGFDATVTWENTEETYSSTNGTVEEVVPAYYIDGEVGVTVTDISGGPNTVDYDMAVV